MTKLETLKQLLGQVMDLRAAKAVLDWDQETYMPHGGTSARALQAATLAELAHERFVSDEIGMLLDDLAPEVAHLDPDADDRRLVQVTRRDYDLERKLSGELVAELARTSALAKEAWQAARRASDFSRYAPLLERIVELSIRKAEALGYRERPYDALLDLYEPDMTTAQVAEIFTGLRANLIDIVRAIRANEPPEDGFMHEPYDSEAQWAFGLAVIRDFGFDLDRGRQDISAHPFTTNFSVDDVRLTTRIKEDFLPSALFGSMHECGHGLYEQNVDPGLDRTLLAGGTSLGMHESQSMLWENIIGRSRAFWTHYYPKLQARFPDQLGRVDPERFYRAINRVEPSFIRVEADELTYNLHIMLRFELETDLIEHRLRVADLPEAWNAKMEAYLGIVPPNDALGVLQDVHWSEALIGYFPTYALGKLISAQLWDQAKQDIPDLEQQVAAGQFHALLGWLREHVHRHGRKFTANELLVRSTGRPLEPESWLAYVRAKYGALYDFGF